MTYVTPKDAAGSAGLAAMEIALPCTAGARRGEEGLSRADLNCRCTLDLPMNRDSSARTPAVHPKSQSVAGAGL